VCADLGSPTNFDYLVLASAADSPRFLAMAGYRSMPMRHAELLPDAEPTTVVYPRTIAHCIDRGATAYGAGPLVAATGSN
jgi:hypothetical protein